MPRPVDVPPKRILPALVLAQLAGTSTWFAVNAVMPALQAEFGWAPSAVGTLTSAVQLGFITGALVLALLSVADRYSARRVFLFSSIAQALCTLIAVAVAESFTALCVWRFLTGFLLAGIYPVGMKIAAQWFPHGLGHALGLLIGALVLGSAFPHALRGAAVGWPWHYVFYAVAAIAAAAGVLLVALIPEPPENTARPSGLQFRALWAAAGERRVRASVLGYFGHMWELYTLWVLMPMILATRLSDPVAISWSAFVSLGMGAVGCAVGGWIATRVGSAPVAGAMLGVSGLCCFISPWALEAPLVLFGAWLMIWGFSISGDSPQFSALTARNSPPALVGSVLTLTNSIGFAISILSIQLFVWLAQTYPLAQLLPWMGIGPVLGVWALRPLLGRRQAMERRHCGFAGTRPGPKIAYFCHPAHAYTLLGWLAHYPVRERGDIRIVGYPDIGAPLPPDVRSCIFSDIDRIEPSHLAEAARVWDELDARGLRLLNHPLRSLRRFDLQQALSNDFRLFRDRVPDDARYPLFLRYENDHGGAITPLLRDTEELRNRWEALPGAIALEFLDTSDEAGIFRKYSAMRLGDALIPRHVLFSRQWQVKDPDLVTPARIEEERLYLETFPHRDQIMAIFERAGIQYGRIDYALHRGKVQVWEINTNPMLQTARRTRRRARVPIHEMSAPLINRAFRALTG